MSKYFGDHGHFVYLTEFLPVDISRASYPLLLFGFYKFVSDSANKGVR